MVELFHHNGMLAARDPADPGLGIVLADFVGGPAGHRGRVQSARPFHLLRACRVGGGPVLVLDAFAGLGRDGFELARAGATVQMCERNPVVWQLLSDALQRAATNPEYAEVASRITLTPAGDVRDVMQNWQGARPDVIYLDPMYPGESGSAKVRKQSQLLRRLAGSDDSGPEVLMQAVSLARLRVVVKRPANATALSAGLSGIAEPSGAIRTSGTRYDIYPSASRLNT